jgi:outer membrane protein assembly factor BamE
MQSYFIAKAQFNFPQALAHIVILTFCTPIGCSMLFSKNRAYIPRNCFFKHTALIFAMLFITACSVYKPDIAQGNITTAEQVAALKQGISRQQVQQILGSPLLQDVFNSNRWDYVYRYLKSSGAFEQRVLTLFFDANGKLERWSGEVAPDQKDIGLMPAAVPKLSSPLSSPTPTETAASVTATNVPKLALNAAVIDLHKDTIAPTEIPVVSKPASSIEIEPKPVTLQTAPSSLSTAQSKPIATPSPNISDIIKETISAWRTAWASKNIAQYAAYYTPDYKGSFSTHQHWLNDRQQMFDTSGDISITLSNIKVIQTSSTEVRAELTQAYRSARLTENGVKQLFFQRTSDVWHIINERFVKRV